MPVFIVDNWNALDIFNMQQPVIEKSLMLMIYSDELSLKLTCVVLLWRDKM